MGWGWGLLVADGYPGLESADWDHWGKDIYDKVIYASEMQIRNVHQTIQRITQRVK